MGALKYVFYTMSRYYLLGRVSVQKISSCRGLMVTFPNVITQMIQMVVSVKRLTKFLTMEELDLNQVDRTPNRGEWLNN